MPVHDWSRIEPGIFHDFHHAWIEEIKRSLNNGILPNDYYALAEQHAAGFGPDVLTLQTTGSSNFDSPMIDGASSVLLTEPKVSVTAETDMEFYRRRQSSVAVRHVSGDRVVAMVEIVSPGNKASRGGIHSFISKAADLIDRGIQLLILDVHAPSARDPDGIHGLIWEEITGQSYDAPPDKPLTLASYESGSSVRAFVEPIAVGDPLTDMPLFLEPGGHILVPSEATYERSLEAMPRRWRECLEPH